MRWIEDMRKEPPDPGGSFFLALRTANQKRRRGHNRRRLIRALGTIVAIISSVGAIAQTAPDASRFVVVLDAAHGGDDAGARLEGEAEKAYTLALSVRLRSLLAARGFSVVTTRESDATVDPNLRAEIANHAGAQACLSLHAAEDGSGVHLFVSSLAPVDTRGLLPWKTAQAGWIMRSLSFAGVVDSALSHASIPVTLGRIALPAIDSMACPAVTVEVAPMRSNEAQGPAGLDDPDYQARVADALAAALVEWRSQAREDQQH
jgi:N-acetylmuramoyl-L-alanine amidase